MSMLADRLRRRLAAWAGNVVAKGFLLGGGRRWNADPHAIGKAVAEVEQAWSLSRDPMIAVQLTAMYDRINRHDKALAVLRRAFQDDPRHPLVRFHAAATLLRHGRIEEVRDFVESVRAIDPDDAFARFIGPLLGKYPDWVRDLAAAIARARAGRPAFLIACPVWGPVHSGYFLRYLCATLLADNNVPALTRSHAVHLAIFTTAASEALLRSDPLFQRLAALATVTFIHFSEDQVGYRQAMEAHYGQGGVPHSEQSLAFFYARICKFVLMSLSHYVALAAGRAADAKVSCQVADLILNDGALRYLADALADRADAVLVHTIQLKGKEVRPALEGKFRRADGVLQISSSDCAKLVVDHMPERNFADSSRLFDIPIRICWRVGREAILAHANHYHPLGLRPAAFVHPLELTIDPIDSRFIDRTSLSSERIELIGDDSIVGLSVDDDPSLDEAEQGRGTLVIPDFALWLAGFWGRLRGPFFRAPLRYGHAEGDEWDRAVGQATAVVEAIVARAAQSHLRWADDRSWLPVRPSEKA